MNHWNRLLYAVALTGILVAVFLLVSAIVAPEMMAGFLTQPYWVAVFVLSYLIAPVLNRYVRRW